MFNTLFLATASLLYFVISPVATLREAPTDASPIESQAYFSEEVKILEEVGEWTKVETPIDGAQGWVKQGAFYARETPFPDPSKKRVKVNRLAAHLYHATDTIYGPLLTLPFESLLEVVGPDEDPTSRWIKVALPDGREAFIQRGDVTLNLDLIAFCDLPALSRQFLGLPYTWGGCSSFGYDCSGFVQMLYRQAGFFIPRNSRDQAAWEGFTAVSIEALSPGDLIFFGPEQGVIRHVGMYIGSGQFIHSTVQENAPYIRISRLSDPEWSGSGKFFYRIARTLKKG